MSGEIQGVRIVSEFVEGGPNPTSFSQTSLIAHNRNRNEVSSANAYDIERRDLKKTFRVFVSQRTYQELPIFELLSSAERAAFARSGRHWTKYFVGQQIAPPVDSRVRVEYRKGSEESMMFGCIARKWFVTYTEQRKGQFVTNYVEKTSEAWYLDIEQTLKLYPSFPIGEDQKGLSFVAINGGIPTVQQRGEAPKGFCALSISKITRRSEQVTGDVLEDEYGHSFRVVSLEQESLAEQMFEPPYGFRKIAVYPSRLTMAKEDALDVIKRLKYKVSSAHFNRAGRS